MNIFFAKLKKWYKMCSGKSVFHMKQAEGKFYRPNCVLGYYSDLRHKVLGDVLVDAHGVSCNLTQKGEIVYFPISIFQYGLGAYDLYLETKRKEYLDRFYCQVKWALDNQLDSGAWNAFGWITSGFSYSSMAQGEGASLLCRAYEVSGDRKYLDAAINAVRYMLKTADEGGTAIYDGENITLEESEETLTILNGMIFSLWGLYDVCLLCDDVELKLVLSRVIRTLCRILPRYDRGYWSNYDLDGHIASPFYHSLHIAQLKVMYHLTGENIFRQTAEKWELYQKSFVKSKVAFLVKAIQKLSTLSDDEIILVK